LKVALFRCRWVTNGKRAVSKDKHGYVSVDLRVIGYKNDMGSPFCNIKDVMYWWNFNPFCNIWDVVELNLACNVFCQRYYIYFVYIYIASVQ
jgi:hypothetical protein